MKKDNELIGLDGWYVSCPHCGVGKFVPCMTPSGKIVLLPHKSRLDKAQKKWAAKRRTVLNNHVKVGECYLLRVSKEQVPVIVTNFREKHLEMKTRDKTYVRRSARSLSKHFDGCPLVVCDCVCRLQSIANEIYLTNQPIGDSIK